MVEMGHPFISSRQPVGDADSSVGGMKHSLKYQVIITWSERDAAFVAKAPELPGCMAHGATYEEALRNTDDAMIFWLDTVREDGITIPEPRQYAAAG